MIWIIVLVAVERMAPGGSNNLAILAICTVFKSLEEFTWPRQRAHRQGQTQTDPACFCTDRQPDRQPTEQLTDYGM